MPKRRKDIAIAGLILAVAGLVTWAVTAVPAMMICIVALRRKQDKRWAFAGIAVSLLAVVLALPTMLTLTPAGSVGPPLNVYKYRRACESAFWLDFDSESMSDVLCRRHPIFGTLGSVHFESNEQGRYSVENVIDYARRNGWAYGGKLQVTAEQWRRFRDEEQAGNESWDMWRTLSETTGYFHEVPLWITETCTILAFDTGHPVGIPSYAMISEAGTELAIYANEGVYPDGPHEFQMPPLFDPADENSASGS